jgi:hypothetical protein
LSQRLEEKNGYKQDTQGNWLPQNDKRSSFESQGASPYFQGNYQKKSYETHSYSKKSWSGNQEFPRQTYSGNTNGSRFQKSSRFNRQGANESNLAAKMPDPYQTNTYSTTAAQETTRPNIAKPSDAPTNRRRAVFKSPEIVDWKEQRSLSLEQAKGILGH